MVMACEHHVHIVLLKNGDQLVTEVCNLRFIGMLGRTIDVLVKGHDPPFTVCIGLYGLLHELPVLCHVGILGI